MYFLRRIPTELIRTRSHEEILRDFRETKQVPPTTTAAALVIPPGTPTKSGNNDIFAFESLTDIEDRENEVPPETVTVRQAGKLRFAAPPTNQNAPVPGVGSKLPTRSRSLREIQ
jgi:hypothetical protein